MLTEAAQALAARVLREKPTASLAERLRYAFVVCLSRLPTSTEMDWLNKQYEETAAGSPDIPLKVAALA